MYYKKFFPLLKYNIKCFFFNFINFFFFLDLRFIFSGEKNFKNYFLNFFKYLDKNLESNIFGKKSLRHFFFFLIFFSDSWFYYFLFVFCLFFLLLFIIIIFFFLRCLILMIQLTTWGWMDISDDFFFSSRQFINDQLQVFSIILFFLKIFFQIIFL